MTKIDIFSGFLGAGKTTLIKKLLKEGYKSEKVVLIENEFGEIGIDGGFLKDAGIEITEMNSGCICCSLVGDFTKALQKVIDEYKPDRIIIEPSGVGKLSDVVKATEKVVSENCRLNCLTTVVDAGKCKMYIKNFGEFFVDQIENATSIVFSHTDVVKEHKTEEAIQLVREHNEKAQIIATPFAELEGSAILAAMEEENRLSAEVSELEHEHHHHHDHHHEHGEDCKCGCHDHDHHHEHGEDCKCGCHDHDHHHEHGEDCKCGCHDHDHHHHHADEVFASVGVETTKKFTVDKLAEILDSFDEEDSYGMILRAKGIVAGEDGKWIHFDYVPGESNIRIGASDIIGRLCVIGSKIDKSKIKELFGV